jgi:hypothetical protein
VRPDDIEEEGSGSGSDDLDVEDRGSLERVADGRGPEDVVMEGIDVGLRRIRC